MRMLGRPLTLEQAWLRTHELDELAAGVYVGDDDARATDDAWRDEEPEAGARLRRGALAHETSAAAG